MLALVKMMSANKFFKTILFFILFLFVVLPVKNALAEKNTYFTPTQEGWEQCVFGGSESDVSSCRYNYMIIDNALKSFQILVGGTETKVAQTNGFTHVGATGQLSGMIAGMISHPPVSTGEYLADLGSNLGLPVKSAYAQSSTGWRALSPILPVWKGFRNVTYIIFVFIFIAVGFMIMFRSKINPQTVVTVQSALPKIILTLLLVTFSYAIAGLMIDLIYIGIYLAVGIFALGNIIIAGDAGTVIDMLLSKNPFQMIFIDGENLLLQGPATAVENLVGSFVGIDWYEDVLEAQKINLVGGLAKLILSIAVLFSLFRLFFALLMSYLSIILSVIFAPFQILANAFPGSNTFGSWLKGLFANVIVFPAVGLMFLLAAVLIGPRNGYNPYHVTSEVGYYPAIESGQDIWVPPFLVIGESGVGANTIQALLAFGIVMMTPQVVTMIKKSLKVEGGGMAAGVMGGLMAAPRMVAAVPSTLFDLGVKGSYMGVGPFKKGDPAAAMGGAASKAQPAKAETG